MITGENLSRVSSVFSNIFIIFLLFVFTLKAETIEDIEDIAQKAHLANINALLIFTSQNGLNSGLFQFNEVGVDMEVYNLPFKFHFNSQSNINYFLLGNVGYSRVYISQDKVIPPDIKLDYEDHLQTYTAGLGGGVRYKFTEDLSVLGGLEIIYSRSGSSVKEAGDGLGEAIEDFFNKNYNDNISYNIFAEVEYKPELELLNPYVVFDYKFFDTKSSFEFTELTSFHSQSNVFSLAIGAESNELFRYETSYLTLEAYLNANYLDGSVVESVKFDKYAKVGGVAYWYIENGPSFIKRFFIEASVIKGDGLDGRNIGIGFSFNY